MIRALLSLSLSDWLHATLREKERGLVDINRPIITLCGPKPRIPFLSSFRVLRAFLCSRGEAVPKMQRNIKKRRRTDRGGGIRVTRNARVRPTYYYIMRALTLSCLFIGNQGREDEKKKPNLFYFLYADGKHDFSRHSQSLDIFFKIFFWGHTFQLSTNRRPL